MRPPAGPSTEAARLAVLQRLEHELPGPGELSVDTLRAPHGEHVVFLCRRSNRIGFILLTVPLSGDPAELVAHALRELAATQRDALATPLPPQAPKAQPAPQPALVRSGREASAGPRAASRLRRSGPRRDRPRERPVS